MRSKLKLFVWEDVLKDYTSGMMVAFAEDVDQARKLLLEQCNYLPNYDLAEEPTVVDSPAAFIVWGGG